MTANLRTPATLAKPFRRAGLGWLFNPPNTSVEFEFTHVRERSEGISCEVHVTYGGEHVMRKQINMLAPNTIQNFAKELAAQGLDNDLCKEWLIVSIEQTIRAFRRGEPSVEISGDIEPTKPIAMLCDPLVMANVTNCWVASAGSGKSTFAKALCVAHATGTHFLGHPVMQGVPMYLDYEDTRENYTRVVDQILRGLDMTKRPTMRYRPMRRSLANEIESIAREVDEYHVTLLVVDAVAAAGGAMTEWGGWEAMALSIEQALQILPPITVLLIDHGTGSEIRDNGIPQRGRGAGRKYEFVRYQWSMVADRGEARQGRHTVGWSHTKSNITGKVADFAVTVIHEQDRVGFADGKLSAVQAIQRELTKTEQIIVVLEEADGKLVTLGDIAMTVYGEDTGPQRNKVAGLLRHAQQSNARLQRASDGAGWWLVQHTEPVNLHAYRGTTDDDF